jgi:hypothetical protein
MGMFSFDFGTLISLLPGEFQRYLMGVKMPYPCLNGGTISGHPVTIKGVRVMTP